MIGVEQNTWQKGMQDRRSGYDRRNRKIPSLRDLFVHRRRAGLRRAEDRRRIFLFDLYSKSDMRVVLAILFLSITDAVLTLYLLSHGAIELNPVMAYFLNINATTFIIVKYLLTAVSVFTIVIFHYAVIKYIQFPVRYLLDCFAGIFALVVVWEIFLVGTHIL